MITVNCNRYQEDLNQFIKKHSKDADLQILTSPFENGRYHKDYLFSDGAWFTEINYMNHTEEIETEVHGIIVKATIKMIKHEYWSTDNSTTKYWYEKA